MSPRLILYLIAALFSFLVLIFVMASRAETKQAFAVCEGKCLKAVSFAPGSRLEVPLRNGKPDYRQGKLYHTNVVVDHALERVEFH